MSCFNDVFIDFDINVITKNKNLSEKIVPICDMVIVLFFIERNGMFHGVLVNDFILFFHESLDVNLVFGKNIFECKKSFFSCVKGNFMLFEL
jgi:hypothetical protein